MTKLINPSDDELLVAFAQHVAGYTDIKYEREADFEIGAWSTSPWEGWRGVSEDDNGSGRRVFLPRVTTSADSVLPWLEKVGRWNVFRDKDGNYELYLEDMPMPESEGAVYFAFGKTFPRAATIALLRTNGVEVVFQ